MTKEIIILAAILAIGFAPGCKAENSPQNDAPQAKEPNTSPSVSHSDANEQIILPLELDVNATKPPVAIATEPPVVNAEPNESSANRFHDKCARILGMYVKEDGRVD